MAIFAAASGATYMNTLSVLIIKVYRIFYLITRVRRLAYILALIFVAVLHTIAILGFAVLLQDLGHMSAIINILTSKHAVLVVLLLTGVNYFFCPTFESIITDVNKASNYSLLVIYVLVDMVLLAFEYLMLR